MRRTAAITVALFLLFAGSRAFAAPEIIKIRYWAAPDHTRIVIDTSEEAEIKIDKSARKLSILFKDCELSDDVPAEKAVNKPGIDKILVEELEDDVRIDLIITAGSDAAVFKLKAIQDKPYRVVVDLTSPELEKKESEKRQQIKDKIKDKVRIVIIDPGHGGEDPGAIGKKKTKEKDVVLQIAKKLESDLNRRDGYRAFLTRSGDYYPSFRKRLQIAREYGADLFVSIHADAARNRSARGGSVYCLSTSGASNEAAKILARNENLADIIGGAENDPAGREESDVIMLDMIQTETINMSKTLGSIVLSNLSDVNKLKFKRVQEAPLRVLKMPHIPSVLVETAYISNPAEEQLLKDQAFQKKLAHAVAGSIVDFLSERDENGMHPAVMAGITPVKKPSAATGEAAATAPERPEEKAAAPVRPAAIGPEDAPEQPREASSRKPAKKSFTYYTVKKGDSLDRIARRNNTTVAELLKANDMKAKTPLYVNRKIRIPAGESAQAEAAETPKKKERIADRFYTVKRGDKLSKIAIRFNTTIAALLKLNNMKMDDPLVIGRKLKVSGEIRTAKAPDTKAPPARAEAASKKAKPKAKAEEDTSEPQEVRKKEKPAETHYLVRKGDTLEKIALRNNTTIAALMKLNDMKKGNQVQAGRRIRIAADPEPEKGAEAAKKESAKSRKTGKKTGNEFSSYVVKKGDTLEKVAVKNHTTIAALLKMNRMKLKDPLLVGKKLKIPAEE
jgi:N-acetylmuramoyl-L-alanine amidase